MDWVGHYLCKINDGSLNKLCFCPSAVCMLFLFSGLRQYLPQYFCPRQREYLLFTTFLTSNLTCSTHPGTLWVSPLVDVPAATLPFLSRAIMPGEKDKIHAIKTQRYCLTFMKSIAPSTETNAALWAHNDILQLLLILFLKQ